MNYSSALALVRNDVPGRRQAGSTLLIVLLMLVIASTVVALSMERSQNSIRMVNDSEVSAELRSAAEGELERLFFVWKQIKSNQSVDKNLVNPPPAADILAPTDTVMFSYLDQPIVSSNTGYNGGSNDNGTKNGDGAAFDNGGFDDFTFGNPNTGAQTTHKYDMQQVGTPVDGLIVGSGVGSTVPGKITTYEMRVWVTKNSLGRPITIRLARTFALAVSAAFQNAVFYNGVMELTAGGSVTVDGAIVGNDDIYLGSVKNGLGTNKLNILSSVTPFGRLNEDESCQADTWYRQDHMYQATAGGTSTKYDPPTFINRMQQAGRLSEAQNFLGGLNAEKVQTDSPALFPTLQDVYRAVITPTPSGTDNVEIHPLRMYEKAGLRLVVSGSGSGTVQIIDPSSGINYAAYPAFSGVVASVRKAVYDRREAQYINMTTIDVGKLKTAIANTAALASSFNGILYAYDSGGGTYKEGIRLTNGTNTPNIVTSSNPAGTGFTVASEDGVYIQGDYNTATGSDGKTNRCVVMGDAVTALSNAWDDTHAADLKILGTRVAQNSVYNCAVLTGDVPTNGLLPSGGAHNLVRLLEDWSGKSFTLDGSLGELFASKYFTGQYQNEADVYSLPTNRYILFDPNLSDNPPNGFVNLTKASRGNYYEFSDRTIDVASGS